MGEAMSTMSERWHDPADKVDEAGLAAFAARIAASRPLEEMTFLCIGTDRSTGDSLGPLVGTLLTKAGIPNVIGTLEQPCDAEKLPDVLQSLRREGALLAIDACLGKPESIGFYLAANRPLVPARSVGKSFPPVGTHSIAGIVNAVSPKPYWTLQATSLHRVMIMARGIASAVIRAWCPDRGESIKLYL